MVGRIALDVAPGSPSLVTLSLVVLFVLMVLLEAGILAALGMRPISKAFTSSFIVNIASVGAGIILYMVAVELGLKSPLRDIFVIIFVTAVQGFILATNRAPLSLGRAWMAAVAMKAASLVMVFSLGQLIL